jgi:hypothetical protein
LLAEVFQSSGRFAWPPHFEACGDDAMHFDYIVLGLLIAGTLSAAAMALSQRKS